MLRRAFFFAFGSASLALGVIGAFLPLLPTVPFLLLSAWCYAQSSERMHTWLIEHPRLGPPIVAWQAHGVIRPRAKVLAVLALAVSLAFPLVLIEIPAVLRAISAVCGACVLTFILTRPSRPRAGASPPEPAASAAEAPPERVA